MRRRQPRAIRVVAVCALVGSGLAAKFGILVRGGGEAFQEAAQLDLVVFDKTGTLTEGGDPRVVDAVLPPDVPSTRWTADVVLGVAAELESASTHPLASAVRGFCAERVATPQTGAALEETAGRGVKARFDALGCFAVIGNEAWMAEHGAVPDGRLWVMGDHRSASADSRSHVDDQYAGTIAVDDVIGKAAVIVWPLDRFGTLDSPDIQGAAAPGVQLTGAAAVAAPHVLGLVGAVPVVAWRRRRRTRRRRRA